MLDPQFNYLRFDKKYEDIPGREEEFADLKLLYQDDEDRPKKYPFIHNPVVKYNNNPNNKNKNTEPDDIKNKNKETQHIEQKITTKMRAGSTVLKKLTC